MYGRVRGTLTLVGVAGAGFLIWIASLFDRYTTGGYWAHAGVLAGAGLAMALSQLLGGWTKWGWPRVSGRVFLWAFVPTFIVVSWLLLGDQPHREWGGAQINDWSKTLHCNGLVHRLGRELPVIPFLLGLVFGFTLDTTGPRVSRAVAVPAEPVPPASVRTGEPGDSTGANAPTDSLEPPRQG